MPYQNWCRRDRNRSSSEYTSEILCGTGGIVESPRASSVRLEFLRPRYWLTWFGLGVLRGIERLPFAAQLRLATGLGYLIRRLPLAYVRIAERNIALCLPQLSPAERGKLLERHCGSLGMGLCETATTWWSSDARVGRLATVEGLEHLAKGRGAILIGGHFTTIEIATRILGTVVPMNVVYRPTKNALLSHVMHASFCRHGKPIRHDDIRAMIRALKHNEAVWYAPDQSYRNKGAAMVKFFGIPAATTTATSRLARISGAAVLTYFPERLPGAGGYRVVIGPPFEGYPGADPVHDVERFHALLEAQIRRIPEQYLWMHRRFKGLAADYPDYYGRDSRSRGPAPAAATAPAKPIV
jgi:KDO2-lipid IV(A) lauroyltransferase